MRDGGGIARRARSASGGFTLVETIAAATLLALGAAVLAAGIGQALHARTYARDTQRTAEVLDELMTKVYLIGPARLLEEGPTEGEVDERFTWRLTIERQLEADLYEAELWLGWTGPRGSRSAELYTLINDPIGSRNPLLAWDDL